MNLLRQTLSDKDYKDSLSKNFTNQPLSVYKWSKNEMLPTHGEARQKYLNNLNLIVVSQMEELTGGEKRKHGSSMRSNYSKTNSSFNHNGTKPFSASKNNGGDIPLIREEFDEKMDYEIQEKYDRDLISKYKYTVKDINEKIILINDETKKLISDIIMENTVYNLISETVYGENDLTVKPRIYFFLGKSPVNQEGNNVNDNDKEGVIGNNSNEENNKEDVVEGEKINMNEEEKKIEENASNNSKIAASSNSKVASNSSKAVK